MKRLILSVAISLLLSVAAFAQQRPLITDDIDIIPPGTLEIGVGVDFFQKAKFPLSDMTGDLTRIADIRVRQGFASNVEIQIEGAIQNYVAINSIGPNGIPLNITGNSTNDFDDYTISAKVKLRSESKHFPAIGMKFGYQMPNSNQTKGIGTNQINIFSKIIVQKKFGNVVNNTAKLNTYGNIGLGMMTSPLLQFSQNDVMLYGLAGIYRLNDTMNIVAEVNGRANMRSGGAPVGTESVGQFRVGTQIKASGLRFDAAAAFGLTEFSPKTGIIFGVTYQTPTIFKPAQ